MKPQILPRARLSGLASWEFAVYLLSPCVWRTDLVGEVLYPTWQPWDIVLWDNRSARKVTGVEERLAARGARLLRLSPSAPDFNPLEQCWSKIKTCLRRAKARTVEALIMAIKEALDTVTTTDIRGWFAQCGYPVHCYADRSKSLLRAYCCGSGDGAGDGQMRFQT
jgi:hypothetical protein